ncbi:hypothetical protein FACS189444_2570 [Spirochaetia bacterium]|nr:hypothetical protein FACS189444_2570 [Spirochaetia bacterium]
MKAIVPALRVLFALLIIPILGSCGSVPTATPPETVQAPPPERLEPVPEPLDNTQAILTGMAALLGQNDYDGALALFDLMEPEEAESTGIRLIRASVLNSAGRLKEGRTIVEEILAKEPANVEALFVLAALEGASGKEKEQRQLLEKIIAAQPAHIDALNELGNIALRARSLKTAAGYFDKVLAAAPDNGDALVGRAGVYRYNREPQKAADLLTKAIRLYPQWAAPLSERARIYREQGYPAEALADMDRAVRLDPNNYWIAYDRGITLMDLRKKQEALVEFTRAISLDPETFLAYVYTAGIKDDNGDYEGAERDYTILTRLKPDYYFAWEGLGMLKMKQGLWAEARDAFLEAYKQAPQEHTYALLAAMNWMRAGKLSDPKQFLETSLRKVPRDTMEYYMMRLYYELSGDNEVAMRIEKEKGLDTKARMLYYLAHYYDVRGNANLANRYFLLCQEMNRRYIPEWRLNEWAVAERNLIALH